MFFFRIMQTSLTYTLRNLWEGYVQAGLKGLSIIRSNLFIGNTMLWTWRKETKRIFIKSLQCYRTFVCFKNSYWYFYIYKWDRLKKSSLPKNYPCDITWKKYPFHQEALSLKWNHCSRGRLFPLVAHRKPEKTSPWRVHPLEWTLLLHVQDFHCFKFEVLCVLTKKNNTYTNKVKWNWGIDICPEAF